MIMLAVMIMLAIEELKIVISFRTCEASIHMKPCKNNLELGMKIPRLRLSLVLQVSWFWGRFPQNRWKHPYSCIQRSLHQILAWWVLSSRGELYQATLCSLQTTLPAKTWHNSGRPIVLSYAGICRETQDRMKGFKETLAALSPGNVSSQLSILISFREQLFWHKKQICKTEKHSPEVLMQYKRKLLRSLKINKQNNHKCLKEIIPSLVCSSHRCVWQWGTKSKEHNKSQKAELKGEAPSHRCPQLALLLTSTTKPNHG